MCWIYALTFVFSNNITLLTQEKRTTGCGITEEFGKCDHLMEMWLEFLERKRPKTK